MARASQSPACCRPTTPRTRASCHGLRRADPRHTVPKRLLRENESDLVIIVTPRLVRPAVPGQKLLTPHDQKRRGQRPRLLPARPARDPEHFDAPYGHILELGSPLDQLSIKGNRHVSANACSARSRRAARPGCAPHLPVTRNIAPVAIASRSSTAMPWLTTSPCRRSILGRPTRATTGSMSTVSGCCRRRALQGQQEHSAQGADDADDQHGKRCRHGK